MVSRARFRQRVLAEVRRDPTVPVRQVFQAVKVAIRRVTHHNWCPQVVVCDFENALKTALESEFPQARINFNTLVNGRRTRRVVRHYPAMEDFITYVRNTYIRPGSIFLPALECL
ncbi:hypothetical protein SKAU_G00277890 [Synaphobranchus kaupii]|uniref:Uncharacterized protein n=1 Tax=Synaphobranchus kaupii TaxID=118154 RepID=A0A9Q1INQ6_SYNKA|nr:hypothetical protein SKAU_G00277890 [Synaphobranchus kaupii]